MATNYYTTTYLLASLKRRGLVPTSNSTFTDTELLAIADEELQTFIVPLLVSIREEYFVAETNINIIAGTSDYNIPSRAIGGKFRDVLVQSGDGWAPLVRVEPERETGSGTTGAVNGYIIRGNKIVLDPTPSDGGVLKVRHFQRPSRLVATTAVGSVSVAAAAGSTSFTITSAPATFLTTETYDVVQGTPGFDVYAKDLVASVASTTMTFTTAVTPAVAVGDYICLAGETVIPQIPVELHPLLSERVAFRVWAALGKSDKAGQLEKQADAMAARAKILLANRSEGASRVIINRNAPGFGSYRRSAPSGSSGDNGGLY